MAKKRLSELTSTELEKELRRLEALMIPVGIRLVYLSEDTGLHTRDLESPNLSPGEVSALHDLALDAAALALELGEDGQTEESLLCLQAVLSERGRFDVPALGGLTKVRLRSAWHWLTR